MKQWNKVAFCVGVALTSCSALAANHVADGRSNGMGNTGVSSADYLSAAFFNPALVANYKNEDDFALLLPAIGVNVRDSDESLQTISDLQDSIDEFESVMTPSQENIDELNQYLDDLQGNSPLTVSSSLGLALAIPTKWVSANLFARGYVEVIAAPDVADYKGDTAQNVEDRFNETEVAVAAFGYTEFGLALAREFVLYEERVSFGVTPKIQQLTTYYMKPTVKDFDVEDYDQSENSQSAFNLDLGAVWYKNNFQVGLAVKDLLSQEIDLNDTMGVKRDVYELNTQVSAGVSYHSEFVTVAFDADLTKQERFKSLNDETQFVRVGVEGNAWGWAQLRAGYEIDLEDTVENAFTAGIGISPFDVVSLDIAGNYAGDNQFGVSGNLAFTF
ncbi:conjugal transfer protein TraF [Vibrio sp. IRLE0018]|uniref:conjugal transfer protein TraF n=1 Tax=Vibrio TaxID=662 RepID=UPI0015941126|nr:MULTISPECIES: conjugal transfer protein TraF [Vibrio]MCF8777561.1 conjugal transfer protein TraF [Vibrio floridensis]NVC61546.1 type IX secretion system membrane protein PorP/SprF [Vibrio sp. 05-20-BW147]HAS6346701.1 type IX secretion system membrane protein PorP/SprF [Vibrio vulnificus]